MIVVKEVPDSLTIPDSVETDPSLLVTWWCDSVVIDEVVGGGSSDRGEGSTRFTNNTRTQLKQIHHCWLTWVVVNSVVMSDEGGWWWDVVIVVKEVPDSLTIPDSVETDPSLLVTSGSGESVVTSAATLDEVGGGRSSDGE